MHCSRVREVAPGKLQRCCAVVEQDFLPAADGSARTVHALLRCPRCNGGRMVEHRGVAGARGIYHDVLDMIALLDGRGDDVTSTPERWELVRAVWAARADDRGAGNDDDDGDGADDDGGGRVGSPRA